MYKPTTPMWQPTAALLFKISVLTSTLAILGITTGCTSTPQASKISTSKQTGYLDASSLDSLEDLLSATDMRAVEGDRLLVLKHGDVWKRMTVGFKMDLDRWDPRIEAQRSWFISRQPYLDRLSARASRYLYHTVKEAERRGLPTELALLPVIESSYDPAATSSAAAAGLWQFIPSTGRIYGLQQTGLYDGRRDVVESTRAAYEFLGSLYNQFGSWELALAAYNAGPGRIQQAINRNKAAGLPTDYWSLRLPQETMNYVPRFLAVAQIIKNPRAYNVTLPPIANRPHFREVALKAPMELNQIASITGLSRSEIYALNPGQRGEIIDPSSPMRILIPADLSPAIDAKLRNTKPSSSALLASNVSRPTGAENLSINERTVSPTVKETIRSTSSAPTQSVIASTSPSTTFTVKKPTPQGSDALASFAANADIPSAPRIPVAVTTAPNITPVRVEPPISAKEREQIVAAVKAEGLKENVEQVLQPQASQAEKERVIAEIKAIAPTGTEIVDPYDGKIKLTAIQTSQSVAEQQGKEVSKGFAYPKALVEKEVADNTEDAQRNKDKPFIQTETDLVVVPPKGKRSTYTIVAGDTLAIIASKNGVNWRDIAKWNQIDPDKTLFVGATLYLYDAKPQPMTAKAEAKPDVYVVKANDSLTSVADQFDLSVRELADFNNLSVTDGLLVGQKLQLKASKNTRGDAKNNNNTKKMTTEAYTVKRGEYLKLIADRYNLSNQELADLTPGLSANSSLLVGQKINVPLQDTDSSARDEKVDTRAANSQNKGRIRTENYKVQRGETLSGIAQNAKISVAELAALNGLGTNSSLQFGQILKVPENSIIPEFYVVQSGDSLIQVAEKFNLQPSYLAELNGLDRKANLRIGQKLKLAGEIERTRDNSDEDSPPEVYTVKSGDNLKSIAQRYHLQLDYLADLNGLSRSSTLRVGQKLKLTGELTNSGNTKVDREAKAKVQGNANTEQYTVRSGESLNSIANKVGLSVRELADLNSLKASSMLQVGQTLMIPKKVVDYTVKRGDTLIGLANKFGLDTDALAELNSLKPTAQLRIGSILKVPNL